jgi:hypothetical protein
MIRWAEEHPMEHQPNQKEDRFLTYGDHDQQDQWCYAPGRIVGKFFQVPMADESMSFYSVVWPCKYDYKNWSVFTTQWKLNYIDWRETIPAYEVINCDTMVRHCLLIPESLLDEHNSKTFQEVWPKELWGDQFFNDYDE